MVLTGSAGTSFQGRLSASDRTDGRVAGLWIGAAPVVSLDVASTSPTAIGQAVLDALARSTIAAAAPDAP